MVEGPIVYLKNERARYSFTLGSLTVSQWSGRELSVNGSVGGAHARLRDGQHLRITYDEKQRILKMEEACEGPAPAGGR